MWLIDKSALVRLNISTDAQQWAERVERGLVHITAVTRLEIGYSARSANDLRVFRSRPPLLQMPIEYVTPAMEDRAIEVQQRLAERGHHRAPGVADLLVAAVAEYSRRTLLHLDKDFELIAELTGQPLERLRF